MCAARGAVILLKEVVQANGPGVLPLNVVLIRWWNGVIVIEIGVCFDLIESKKDI